MIDSRERLITAVAEGNVRREEMDAYLHVMAGARAGNYRKLFDGSRGETEMTADDIMAVAVRIRGMQQLGQAGPLAIVMSRDKYEQFARVLGILAVPDRPMQFFSDAGSARAWLDEPQIRAWMDGHSA
ncbi:MAG TPA: hypothetical protein VKY24_02865 [Reyranella sp.]|nr:hypothetical protein [Reyranella sp.]